MVWESGIVLGFVGIILIYIGIVSLVDAKEQLNMFFKLFLMIFVFWSIPLLVQLLSEIASANSASAGIITVLDTVFRVTMIVASISTGYFVLLILLLILGKLGTTNGE